VVKSKKSFLKDSVKKYLKNELAKTPENASKEELFFAFSRAIRDSFIDLWQKREEAYFTKGKKQAYYLSSEFLMGRFFSNNVINLKLEEELKEVLEELGIDYNMLENVETDAGLGNGGLGRLAACFLDSAATLNLPLHGYGIRYQYGMFKQKIQNGFQVEYPNNWLKYGSPLEIKRLDEQVCIRFGGDVNVNFKAGGAHFQQENYETVNAIPYDYPIVGYGNNKINTLRLWASESPEFFNLVAFNNGDYNEALRKNNEAKNISRILYPNDNHKEGKILRLRQQYFFSSASLQDLIRKYKKYTDGDFSNLSDYISIQLNDTHPVVAIPELMRILLDIEGIEWEDAWKITQSVFSYTNHTIMQEALEKWDIGIFRPLLPRIYQIIEEVNRRLLLKLQTKYPNNYQKYNNMAILLNGQIRMAFLAIESANSVNGVAELHTQILKTQELKDWYELYPEKFNNKTNGVTQRRWLLKSNPELAKLITAKIGEGWITNLDELKELKRFGDDKKFQKEFHNIKLNNKIKLAKYIKEHNNIDIDVNSIFDVQVKRLHEYKRQLLNVFHILYLYNRLKNDSTFDVYPRTFIFSAKSASGYHRAKLIIKLINSIADIINNDESIKNKIKVVFLENYNVSLAEIIFPASDLSEQISTASKEASGTGNMKFMLNGALTIGTLDGANVEIVEEVGEENAFIFGLKSEEVIDLLNNRTYRPMEIYNSNQDLKDVLDLLTSNTLAPDFPNIFSELYSSLLYGADGGMPDPYFVLKDFHSYIQAQKRAEDHYKNTSKWLESAILNVAFSGKFSSDRTIKEYATEIWKIK
jgi:starch phosphorylase